MLVVVVSVVLMLVLVRSAAPADGGAAAFAQRCAVCHGDTAGGIVGPDIRCHRSIRDAVRAGRTAPKASMPAFPDLSDAELDQLQQHLRTLCPTTDGRTLYVTQCARCHGPSGDGTKQAPPVTCATRLADALKRGRDTAMPKFPGVEENEVAALQAYLDGRCATRGRPADLVYAANCATCHGRSGAGGRNAMWSVGPDLRCTAHDDFVRAVEEGWGGMPGFPALPHPTVEALFRRFHQTRRSPCPSVHSGPADHVHGSGADRTTAPRHPLDS